MVAVSVILPTYNRGHLVTQSIMSVLKQTYNDFEIIVVDDGSRDNTEQVIRNINDPRIVYIKHPVNKGVSAARNTGIKTAKGRYIAFQDSDDEWLPYKLEKQMQLFFQDEIGDLGVVLGEMFYKVDGRDYPSRETPNIKLWGYVTMLSSFTCFRAGTPLLLVKRDLAGSELYFDENLPAFDDWELLLRLSKLCRMDYVKEVVLVAGYSEENHVHTAARRIESRNNLLKKYFDDLIAMSQAVSFAHRQNAHDYYLMKQAHNMRRELWAAMRAYPRSLSIYLHLAIALFGHNAFKAYLSSRSALRSLAKIGE